MDMDSGIKGVSVVVVVVLVVALESDLVVFMFSNKDTHQPTRLMPRGR